jgi:RHS repeat-associated protein
MDNRFKRILAALLLTIAMAHALPGGAQATPVLQGAVSRKVHGTAGTFNLPLGNSTSDPTTEPRFGPTHAIVFTFDGVVTAGAASVTEGTATAGTPTFSGNELVVLLTGVSDVQYVTVAISNVSTAGGGTGGSGSTRIGFLAGDVNQNRVVSLADLGLVNAQLAQLVTASNFLKDVNASGTLTLADKGLTNARLTHALPAPGNGALPPDPATVAPPLDPTVATDILTGTVFLYTGANPIQTGVVPGTIEARRAAVLRGKVETRAGAPLSGVTISILAHPEFGQTLSRADGAFDLAVNGGGGLTVNYRKTGFLAVQRAIVAPWRDYAWLPDVAMIPLDSAVTAVNLSIGAAMQVARGNPVSDTDGARRATILFPQGTTATMTLPGGATQPLTTLNVRATEYTVGASGPKAMPAPLPPSSGYTYAAELSVDEAVTAGAIDVRFNQALPVYVENFLGFPVGSAVPTGFYDRQKGQWIASANGRVIKVLSITSNMADLDIDGTGTATNAAALTALGVTDEERAHVAQLYAAGQTLWRVPINHFTPWDCNWPYGPPPDVPMPPPIPDDPVPDKPVPDDPNRQCGSIIGCEDQSLGQWVPVSGTPWRLHYQSDRLPGRKDANTLTIPLSEATPLPASLLAIRAEVNIAGHLYQATFAPAVNLSYTVTWDGKDSYGRRLQGAQTANVQVHYDYVPQYYAVSADQTNSFARAESAGFAISASRAANTVTLTRTWTQTVGQPWNARASGLGGWSLSVQHAYDAGAGTLLLGDGRQRHADALPLIVTTVAGTGVLGFSGDGGPATAAQLAANVGTVAVGPDGSSYIADYYNHRIRRVGPDGIITTVAGIGTQGFSGDGGQATAAQLAFPVGVAVGPDRSLYIVDFGNNRIRRVGTDGIITTVAGNGARGFSGDGGPATAASLFDPFAVAAGPDGSIFIPDPVTYRIRRIGPDGIITTVAGNGAPGFSGDGGPATAASIFGTFGVAVGPDGSVYIPDTTDYRVRRVAPDGIITTVAGSGASGFSGDGGPATAAKMSRPYSVAVGPDGSLYIGCFDDYRIRRVGPDGIISTLAGTGVQGFTGDGGPAAAAHLDVPYGIALAPDGSLIVSQSTRIRRVRSPLPDISGVNTYVLPSGDGSELYIFDITGRHLKTLDALTSALRYQFSYSVDGYLTALTDGSGNVATVERSGPVPAAIVAPDGQRTVFAINPDGWLLSIANPASEAHVMAYSADGLLQTFTDPRGNIHHHAYDTLGRLIMDQDPVGGSTVLARTEQGNGYTVTTSSALGLTHEYQVERLPASVVRRTVTDASGAKTITVINTDGSRQVTYPDGTVANQVNGPDPRFGMQAPIVQSQTLTTPGGRTQVMTRTQAVTLANPNDLLSLTTLADTLTIDGRTTTTNYDAATRTLTLHTPANRTATATLDARGLVTQTQMTGLEPIAFGYTANGRVSTVTEGTGGTARTTTLTYGSAGPSAAYLARIDDALGRQTSFSYDTAGRATQQTLPGGRIVAFGYDADGNLTSVTPPGRAAHMFAYRGDQQLASYTPPTIAGGGAAIAYAYDSDGRPVRVTQADGQLVDVAYDATGRPTRLTEAGRIIDVTYQGTSTNIQSIAGPLGQQLSYGVDGPILISQTWSGPIAGTVSRTLDNGLRTATRTVNAAAVSLSYDQDSQLIGAGTLTLTRNPNHGLVSGTTLGGVTDASTYSGFGGLDHYIASYSGTAFFDVQYTRDGLGRITTRIETIAGITDTYAYDYDPAGRLAAVRKNGATTHAYSYDGNGNRLTVNAVTATFDGQDRLAQSGTTNFAYSLNGELQTKIATGGTTSYSYDAIGNLLNVSLPGATVDYLFDGLSRRIGKKVGGALVQGWLYDERGRIVAELDGAGALASRFVYASRPNVPDYMVRSGAQYRLVSDPLGTVRLVVKSDDGTIAQRLDYDPFGSVTNDTAPGFQPFGFAGGLFDRDTRLVRFGARDYDPDAARWTTKDPIFFAGGDTNLYAYVANDPINRHDSNGLDGPGDSGVCLGPPPDLHLGKPLFLDNTPLPPPPPPLCPTCSVPALPGGGGSSGGGIGTLSLPQLSLGPFTFKPNLNFPSIGDLRDWNPASLFDKFGLKLDAPLNPNFTLPATPKTPGGPDPNGPNPKPQGPQCKREPEHDPGFTSCQ